MRNAFVHALCEAAEHDERIWLLCADLGYSVLEPFIEKFPDRYVNVGIAEQNMIGVAAGLAMAGKTVFVYSIVNFATFRCLEQIRNDACYHALPVKVVSVGAGFSYGPQGYTHHGLEDIAITRVLPGMNVMVPADHWETRAITGLLAGSSGPAYLRLGRANEPAVHSEVPVWEAGRPLVVKRGNDILIIGSGPILAEVIAAAERVPTISSEIWSLPQIKPLPVKAVEDAARRFSLIVTVEEGRIDGGMGSAIAEIVAGLGTGTRVARRGVDDTILENALSQASARKHYGIDSNSLAEFLTSVAQKRPAKLRT